jgi:CIC family chloride channel protein
MEVILGGFSVRHLNAVVVASVSAAVTTRTLVGEEQLLSAPAHSLKAPQELLLYVALGLLVAAVCVLFLRAIGAAGKMAARRVGRPWRRPVIGGLLVAALAVAEPDLLGTGQAVVTSLVRLTATSELLWVTLIAVAIGKTAAVAVTINSGGSGGAFMPSLFVGSHLGAALALLVAPVWGFSSLDPGAFAVVGMAAAFAAMGRAPLTAILIVFEITGDYGLVLPLMLTTSLATFISERVHRDSVYSLPLTRRGIHLPRHEDIDLLDMVTVGEVMSPATTKLRPGMSTADVLDVFTKERHHGLAVADGERLVGLITLHDIQRAGGASEDVPVEEVMVARPVTVTPSMPVSAALARMAALGIGRMPVVAESDASQLVGMFRRESVVRAYHHALGTATDRGVYRERLKARLAPGASFFEVPVPAGSPAAGKAIRDLVWPEDATLVSIRRGGSVLIPHGDTTLSVGDTITAFGSGDARIDLAFVLEPSDDPVR